MKEISIVVPVYNEATNLSQFLGKLRDVLSKISNYRYEIIFVNDGSTDDSEKILNDFTTQFSYIKTIHLSKNFGKEIALSAGMNIAKSDAVITMDADLQHPPELIVMFLERWEAGNDVVVALRNSHKGESFIKRFGSFLFYFILKNISDNEVVPYATDFRLISRPVLDVFALCEERNRMTRGLIDWLGFKKSYISYDSGLRNGKPSYSTLKLTRLAMVSFVKNSLFPLKFVGYLGTLLTVISSIIGIIVFSNKYIFGHGWGVDFSAVDLMSMVLAFGMGLVLMCMGILALYVADIQIEVRRRPIYIIKDKKNI